MTQKPYAALKSLCLALLCALGLACLLPATTANAESVGERVDSATQSAKTAVEDAGKTALSKIEQLWAKIDSARLKNRTRDQVVAWAIMGLLVGGLLSRMTGLKSFVSFALGLLGAFLGGIIVSVTELDFGMGPVLIRYEDLLISLAGAVVILLLAKWIAGRKKTKTS